ncbi:GUN4 domain-containing protein [Microcystis aeruginosa]|uniref:GUN4 domain-containing protein n=1 Tax=Microcystis aeruginosa TaxID=1126 RepID=UPI00084A04A4|nr:GUN4 domain-containing protein [Microcystis aeruginosa]MDB9387750.1 GUN4 domain-containing protein [Microcystis aeruginosa CS-583]ODV40367.1 serine/threonine kinase [Microcystis aeruginosa NIES-98]
MKKAFWGCLALTGITASLVGIKIAQAQRNSLIVKDANGKEVIVYQESHALVIWAGDYKNWGKLNNLQYEAKEVITALQKQGFQVREIPNPNRTKLSNGIKDFIDDYGYRQNNRLVIFFAGHGYTRQQTKGYLVPVDAPDPIVDEQGFLKAALSMEQINSWATQMEAKHVLFVFDSCFSGTIFKQRSNGEDAGNAYIRDVMNKPVRQFLTAGDANEKVPAKSVFTPLFLRALEGEADYTKDGYVTGSELGLYLTQHLPNLTRGNQHPQFGTILDVNLNRGDIVFRSSIAVVSPQPSPSPPVLTPPKSTPSNPPIQPRSTLISSTTGVDYAPLRELLQQKKWKEADDITFKLMLASAKYQNPDWKNRDWLDEKDINSFACEDLKFIDRLWSEYSNNQLGLSAQLKFWNDAKNNSTTIIEAYRQFAQWVQWILPSSTSSGSSYISSDDIKYANPPQGHLPVQITYPLGEGWSDGGSNTNRHLLYSRFADCRKKGN